MKTIHHVAIIWSDRDKALAFYHEKLGLPIIREHYREKRDDWKIDLEMDGCELELFIMKNCPKRPSYPEAYGLRHMAFKVASVPETAAELRKMGIACEPIRMDDYTGKCMTFFRDPDGLPIEIHE